MTIESRRDAAAALAAHINRYTGRETGGRMRLVGIAFGPFVATLVATFALERELGVRP